MAAFIIGGIAVLGIGLAVDGALLTRAVVRRPRYRRSFDRTLLRHVD